MGSQVRVGVIGTGGMGGRHARNLARDVAGASVVALVDPDPVRLAAAVAETGATHALADASALIAHPDVDAVVIAAPDRFHADLARECIAARKPVLCEKPLATHAGDARRVVDAEIAGGTRLVQLGFMREYDPAHVEVKRLAARGDLGRPLAFRGVHVNATKNMLRSIEDVISNSVVHDIHSARWLMGEEIVEVHARTIPGAADRPDTARFALVSLRFASGAVGTIECNSESGYGYEVDVRVSAERGALETASRRQPWVSHAGSRGQPIEPDWLERFDTAYLLEARAWIESVARGEPTGPSAWDGYVAMVVADACVASVKSAQSVQVPPPSMPAIYARG